jgi:hypothetical protein
MKSETLEWNCIWTYVIVVDTRYVVICVGFSYFLHFVGQQADHNQLLRSEYGSFRISLLLTCFPFIDQYFIHHRNSVMDQLNACKKCYVTYNRKAMYFYIP